VPVSAVRFADGVYVFLCVYAMWWWGVMFGVLLSHVTRISVSFSEQ